MNTASPTLFTRIESIAGPSYMELCRSSTGRLLIQLVDPDGYELNNFWRVWATRQIYKVIGRRFVDAVLPLGVDRLHVVPGRRTTLFSLLLY